MFIQNEISTIKKVGWGFGRCNQSCEHCYNSSTVDGPEYTFNQLSCVADKICPSINDINFGTGEFIFNPNTVDLVEYIQDRYPHIKFSLTTNGSSVVMMQPKKVKSFFDDIDISLDFPNKDKHNAFRRHNMAWQWVMDTLNILKDLRITRSIVVTVTSKTTNRDICELVELAHKYGANLRLNWFRQTGRGSEGLRVKPERAWEIIKILSDRVVFLSLDSIFAGLLGVDSYICPAGITSCRIHQDMEISCYPFLKGERWSGGNLTNINTTIDSIFNSEIFQNIRGKTIPFCESCDYWNKCRGGCITRAVLHSGGIDKPDDFCPFYAKIDIDNIKNISIKKIKGSDLVHDGYLCTTICSPM